MIGDRQCVELQFYRALHQTVQTACPIKQGELRVHMKMYKFRSHKSESICGDQGCQVEVVVCCGWQIISYVMLAFVTCRAHDLLTPADS